MFKRLFRAIYNWWNYEGMTKREIEDLEHDQAWYEQTQRDQARLAQEVFRTGKIMTGHYNEKGEFVMEEMK